MNWDEHYGNRDALPIEELRPCYGKHVAWSLDGKRILAAGKDDGEVLRGVKAAGLSPEDVVLSYIPFPDETLVGGLFVDAKEE